MKTLLLIDTRDLADIKMHLDSSHFLDTVCESEVDLEDAAMAAIIDMIEAEEGEESSFIYEKDFEDEDTEYPY